MARCCAVSMLVAALLLSFTMAQSPASSAATPPKAFAPSPLTAPSVTSGPSPSPATVRSPLSPPPSTSESPAEVPATSPALISFPPSEAPAPKGSGAVLNRFNVAGSGAVLILAAVLLT